MAHRVKRSLEFFILDQPYAPYIPREPGPIT